MYFKPPVWRLGTKNVGMNKMIKYNTMQIFKTLILLKNVAIKYALHQNLLTNVLLPADSI